MGRSKSLFSCDERAFASLAHRPGLHEVRTCLAAYPGVACMLGWEPVTFRDFTYWLCCSDEIAECLLGLMAVYSVLVGWVPGARMRLYFY